MKILNLTLLFLYLSGLTSCKEEVFVPAEETVEAVTDSPTHSEGFPADYATVFDDSKVHRLDIVLSADEWNDMQANLSTVVSNGRPGSFSDQSPEYFPCEVLYNGLEWKDVGVRYKGNSSLNARSGKLPLRFDFDRFEDDNPAIKNQRFYGFKELSLSSNFDDASLVREKTADDLFRDFGVPAVQTAFYEIYIDKGSGPEYFGVYTLCEVVFDTFLESYFGSSTGNCYKPDGNGAKFARADFTLNDFELKTNEDLNDKSDIREMFDVLHASTRTSDPALWRADLEKVFDVDGFLKYLAANNTIQNWDTYGNMTHNYYLYHDPADDLMKWIVWDNNEAFQQGKREGALSFGMDEVNTTWPLINFIIADETYEAAYKSHLKNFTEGVFNTDRMNNVYSDHEALLSASAASERSGFSYVNGRFSSAVSTLKNHNVSRVSSAENFLK